MLCGAYDMGTIPDAHDMTPHGRVGGSDGQQPLTFTKNDTVMVTGCTGFIGSRLAARLSTQGYSVRGLTRQKMDDTGNISYVRADAFDLPKLTRAMEGIDVAYYMLHSMEGDKDEWQKFAARERLQAQNFLEAAETSGVKRIIYLGGLFDKGSTLSRHMKSRMEVGRILASGSIPVTELRASLIIGAQGGSFVMLQYLVERLRIMICPAWVQSRAQPIAVDDVILYLVGCLNNGDTSGRIFEIGGPDSMTYEQLMKSYSSYLNKSLFVLQIPFLTTRLSSLWVDLITPVKASLARPLVDSLVHDTVVTDHSITKIIPLRLKTVDEAIDVAVKEAASGFAGTKSDIRGEKTGFRLNQTVILLALFALGICGTSYYWLDERYMVYEPLWMAVSAVWYTGVIFAVVMIRNKTRLGYMTAGILSWITMSFWLLDNFHVMFGVSIISDTPSFDMTIRNFAGSILAVIVIVSSHNLFHKIFEYQYRGRPV